MRPTLALAVLPLAIAETLIWAAFYYSFPAFLPMWEADFGWSRGEISGAFTASLVLTGLLAPRAGRLIDRGASTPVFLGSVVAGAVLVALLGLVTTLWQFWAVWVGLGLVNAFCLYEACFAIITVTVGQRARSAITVVTLVAGFAGTVSFPSAYLLAEAFGWRAALMIFAAGIIALALPLAVVGLKALAHHADDPATKPASTGREGREALAKPAFWWLGTAFLTIGLIHGMLISHIRPIIEDRGLAEALAVTVASLVGPMQVLGRVIVVGLGNRIDTFGTAVGCFVGILVGLCLLIGADLLPLLALVFVVPYGAAYGVVSIVRPVITAELLGRAGFGVIAGMLAMPYMFGFASGPVMAAAFWELAGYDFVLGLSAVLAALGLGALLMARRSA